jgi:hypothetical protein
LPAIWKMTIFVPYGTALDNRASMPPVVSPLIPALLTDIGRPLARRKGAKLAQCKSDCQQKYAGCNKGSQRYFLYVQNQRVAFWGGLFRIASHRRQHLVATIIGVEFSVALAADRGAARGGRRRFRDAEGTA